jgi:xanthine dehydrogenase accessory factor
VEGAVYELAEQVLASGEPARERYGFSADNVFAVGLTCGGELDVFVQPASPEANPGLLAAIEAAGAGEPVALARVIGGTAGLAGCGIAVFADRHVGSVGNAGLDSSIVDDVRAMLGRGQTGRRQFARDGTCAIAFDVDASPEVEVFVESWTTPAKMLVFGAIDFAAAVAGIGRFLGYHVVVCDARETFTTPERFPQAHEVVVEWPHRYLASTHTDGRTVVCVLTHDPKFDIPLLTEALRRPLGYVGALGSRRTHADRLRMLHEEGLTETEIARLRAPIGLDIGARTPEETAVSIAAELIALQRGGTGGPLTTTVGPIHREPLQITSTARGARSQ